MQHCPRGCPSDFLAITINRIEILNIGLFHCTLHEIWMIYNMMGIIWEYQDFKNVCQYLWHPPGGGHPVWLTYHYWYGDLRYTQCFPPFVQHPWLWDIGSHFFSPHAHLRHFCMQQIKNERRQTEMSPNWHIDCIHDFYHLIGLQWVSNSLSI